ncbi:MAG: hypothetical protein ACLVKA_00330 [Collinsella aerofaciens]
MRPLYFAQHEICSFTPSKRTLNEHYPGAPSLRSGALVHAVALCARNVLARLERFDEIIEVAPRHAC